MKATRPRLDDDARVYLRRFAAQLREYMPETQSSLVAHNLASRLLDAASYAPDIDTVNEAIATLEGAARAASIAKISRGE